MGGAKGRGELGCVWYSKARLGGGVGGVDWEFGLKWLRLNCYLCDLCFDRHRRVLEGDVGWRGSCIKLCVLQ